MVGIERGLIKVKRRGLPSLYGSPCPDKVVQLCLASYDCFEGIETHVRKATTTMHAIFFIHKTVKREVKINVIDRMNFCAIFKSNLIGNLSNLH